MHLDSFFDTEKNRRLYRQESKKVEDDDSRGAGKGVRCQRGLGVEILQTNRAEGFHHLKISLARELVDAKDDEISHIYLWMIWKVL